MTQLASSFYNRDPLIVAPELLGKILVRRLNNQIISGRIVEAEAYLASTDPASHSYNGPTSRNASLFKSAGHAYVYRIHMQHCLDIVTEKEGTPTSLLIRALEPLTGIDLMQKNRGKHKLKDLTSGPGKLTQALQIDKTFDGQDITNPDSQLYIESDGFVVSNIQTSPRIGISRATDYNYRFFIPDNPYVSHIHLTKSKYNIE